MPNRLLASLLLAAACCWGPGATCWAIDEAHRAKAEGMAARAAAYLIAQQDRPTGGWSVPAPEPGGSASRKPHLPGVTALVLAGLAGQPPGAERDGAMTSGVKYLHRFQQDDGGIYDRILPSYNTSLSVSALAKVDAVGSREIIARAQKFLRGLQWSEASNPGVGGGEAAKPVSRDHPFYGGVGYGKHGRPDGSNLNLFMQALEDSGVSPGDEAVKRAVVFLERLQMLDEVNDMPYADKSRQGGFVYATVENAESVDVRGGQSQAGMIEETLDDGTKVSRLRAYGSMTYAGFKSYLYAELPRTDIRVTAALDWIRRNYTVSENPGMGTDGLYYYYVTFARALRAWGERTIDAVPRDGESKPQARDWANDLIDRLEGLQNEDGSFRSVNQRWMEDDPVLITAYSLIALNEAAPRSQTTPAGQ